MNCTKIQSHFSAYLDGTLSGSNMAAVATHLDTCAPCANEFAALRGMQTMLASLGPVKAPADLGLKLRLAISHQSARRQGHWWDAAGSPWHIARWDNVFRPALFQATAGFASAVALIGTIAMLVGMVAAPQSVLANDEPLGAMTTPHYLYSTAPELPVVTPEDTTIVIQAKVDANGKVYDYKILSGPQDPRTQAEVRGQLMLQQYEPARVFGEPVHGQVLITFAGASVRG